MHCDFRKTYVEHVLHVVDGDERIVDVHNLDLLLQLCGTHNQAADSAESVDSNFDCRPVAYCGLIAKLARIDGKNLRTVVVVGDSGKNKLTLLDGLMRSGKMCVSVQMTIECSDV